MLCQAEVLPMCRSCLLSRCHRAGLRVDAREEAAACDYCPLLATPGFRPEALDTTRRAPKRRPWNWPELYSRGSLSCSLGIATTPWSAPDPVVLEL